ncbi:MAG: phage tail tape measure protein [Ruminiclostridium sp.]
MATAKEYNMMFKLQAQLGREFNSSFNQAQRALQQTKSQILELNKQQADISSYQKQQTAIENTSRKLKDLQKEHDNIQREMRESENYSSALENKLIEKQRAIDNTTIALQKQTEKLNQQKNALQEAGIDTSKLGDESKRLSNELENLAKQEKDAAEEAKKYGDVGADAFTSVGTALTSSGILAGLKAIFEAYSECVSIAGDFQETMSTVEALSGANANDMAALSEQAKELGAITKFTATEAAEAMTYMGMAGWSAEQMISGMDGVLALAAASGEDLALTSDIVTDNLTAFGLKAEDTAHFADVLAAATNSNTSVSVMGETFKQSASIAGALGYSIEDVSTAVGLMANAGVKGSIAGTALKNTFNGLLEGATISAAAIGEVNYSAIKADGTMKSFGETVKELRGYFVQMTEAERVNNAMAIAGQRGYNGLLAIVNSTDKDFQKLTRSINDCDGAASKMAKVRMDNFNGQVTLMNSAMDALKTTIGESFQDELKALAEVATEVLTSANDFLSANPELTKGIVILGGAVAATGAAFGAYTTVSSTINTLKQFKIAANLAASAQKALNLAISAAPYVIAGTALIAFISGINSLSERTEMAQEHIAEMAEGIRQLSDDARMATEEQQQLENVVAEYEKIATTVTDATEKKEALAELQATLNGLYGGEKEGLDLVNGAYDEQIEKLEQLNDIEKDVKISQITQSIEEARAAIAEAESRQIPITFSWNGSNESFENALSDFYKTWQDNGLVLSGGPDNERSLLIEGNIDEQIVLLEEMQQIMRDSKATNYEYAENFQYVTDKLNDLYTLRNAPKELQIEIDRLNGKISDTSVIISGDLYSALIAVSGGYMDVAAAAENYGVGEEQINSAIASAKTYQGLLKNAAGTVISGYQSAEAAAQQYDLTVNAVDISAKIETDIQEIQALAEKYDEALEAATKSVEGQYKLWDDAAEIVAQDIDAINASLQSQNDYWNTYNDNIAVLSEKAKEIEGLREVISTFADGSPDSANMIAGLAKSTDEELKKMVSNWQTVQEEQRLTSEALAELTTGAGDNIDKLREHLNETVKALNIENEAESAAKDSIDAYIKAIEDGTDDAVIAAERLASLVAVALNPNVKVSSLPNGFAGRTPSLEELQKEMSFVGPKMIALSGAYASGTDGAKPGVALVGENGPELVYLAGGEQIYTAEETRLILKEMQEAEQVNNIARVEMQDINKYADGTGAIVPGESSIITAYNILNAIPVNTTEIQIMAFLPELLKQLNEYHTEIGRKPGMNNADFPIPQAPVRYSASAVNAEATPINVALNVNVQSDIDGFADFLEERLNGFSEELIAEVMDAFEEYEMDRERRRYK